MLAAVTTAERESRLVKFGDADFLELAKTVKEISYSFWTSQPTVARTSVKILRTIYKKSPQSEIRAYLEWIAGIAAITRGKLAPAIENLNRAAELFLSLDKEYEAAQTQIAKLYALALSGKRDEAVECGEKILCVFERFGDETAAGKVEKNLGNIVSRDELHHAAERYYLSAQARFIKLNNLEELAMVENGLAITYSAINDFRRAEKFYGQALGRARRAEMFLTEAEIEASLGNLALFRGQFNRALNYLELSRQKYESLKMPHQTAIAELEIADAYLDLNLIDEAFSIYQTTANKFQALKMRGEEARARANFGRTAELKNDIPTARKQLKKAARLFVSERGSGAAVVKIAQANLEINQKNYRQALKIFDEIEDLLSASVNTRHKISTRLIKAEILLGLNENERAGEELAAIYAASIKYGQPNFAQAAQISLGKLAFRENDFRRAETHFKRAIKLIETLRAPLAAEEFKMAFMADKLAPFEYLAKIYLAKKRIKPAFYVIEQARARSLAENLTAVGAAAKISEESVALQVKLADLREELNWFYSRLNRADEDEAASLQAAASQRERQISDVMRQIASTNSSDANSKKSGALPDKSSLINLQFKLGKRKALLEFAVFDGVLSAFVVTDRDLFYFGDLAKESDILSLLETLRFQFGTLRYGAQNLGNFIGELKKRADVCLGKLYDELFAPLAKVIGERDLVIVSVGATHYVPFHALFDGASYLIETREIVYAPSATVWSLLASNRQKKFADALLIGFADEQIPLVNQEIEILRKIFPTAECYTGERAKITAFTENAARFDVIHLACHGQFRPDNPLFSSLHLADGRLTVRDISAQKLNAELVVVSACETGLNKIFPGEEILGLARGFLSAGAKSLLLSLWTVSDEATAELMQIFYERRQAGQSTAEALQTAQKSFIKRGVHPYFWSPFFLIGK